MGWFERLLCRVFRYTDIKREDTGDLYLRRWFIYPRYKEFQKAEPRLYLHKFYRGDEDPYLHDHPWPYTSLILTGGYWEETELEDSPWKPGLSRLSTGIDGDARVQRWHTRLSILKRPATWRHRVILADKTPVWTLVRTGVKERSWGFWVKNKLCPWRTFTEKGVAWCGIESEIPEA